jgi:hypothetical protein
VDAGSGEYPHRGLQRPQLEAEDEVVADAEAVAEGEGPLAPGKNGIAVRSKEDVHRPEEIWPVLLHQRDLSGGRAGGRRSPSELRWAAEGHPSSRRRRRRGAPPPGGEEWRPPRSPAGPPPVAPVHPQVGGGGPGRPPPP